CALSSMEGAPPPDMLLAFDECRPCPKHHRKHSEGWCLLQGCVVFAARLPGVLPTRREISAMPGNSERGGAAAPIHANKFQRHAPRRINIGDEDVENSSRLQPLSHLLHHASWLIEVLEDVEAGNYVE